MISILPMNVPMDKVKYFAWQERYDFSILYDLDFAYGQGLRPCPQAQFVKT